MMMDEDHASDAIAMSDVEQLFFGKRWRKTLYSSIWITTTAAS